MFKLVNWALGENGVPLKPLIYHDFPHLWAIGGIHHFLDTSNYCSFDIGKMSLNSIPL